MTDVKIKVSKAELADVVGRNYKKHLDDYREACEGYRLKLLADLATLLSDLQIGKDIDLALRQVARLPRPQSHGSEYSRVIRMLGMHTGDTLEMSEDQFRNYVEDDWSWSSEFGTSVELYKATK